MLIIPFLGYLGGYVGSVDNLYVLLKPLEYIVCGEESCIRDKVSHFYQ